MTRIGDNRWGAAVPRETLVDHTGADLLGTMLGRYAGKPLRDFGARLVEHAYDVLAAVTLAEMLPERQRHPLKRALRSSIGEVAAAHWWVKSNQEVSALVTQEDVLKMGNISADAQATEVSPWSAKGRCMAVPPPVQAMYGARPTAQGSTYMEWCIHARSTWRPPRVLHARMEQFLRESPETGIWLAPLHVGMWHPRLEACTRYERHEVMTRPCPCPCPCHRPH